MKKTLATLGALTVLGATFIGTPALYSDVSSGAYTEPVFDTADGQFSDASYSVLEDGKTIWIRTGEYFGPLREGDSLKGLTEIHLIDHKTVGTFLDVNGRAILKEVDQSTSQAIYRGEQVRDGARLQIKLSDVAEAAIANTSSKTFAGRNLITSSTTDLTVAAGDSVVVYGGFNNLNTLNSMSLACGSGTIVKPNTGAVVTGAGNAHIWAIAGATPGTLNCTITATSSSFFLVQTSHYSGTQSTSAAVDGNTAGTCTSAASCTTNVTTTLAGDWVVMFGANSAGTPSAGGGTTMRVSDANGIGLGDSNATVAPGSNGLTFTQGAGTNFAQNIIGIAVAAAAVATDAFFNEF